EHADVGHPERAGYVFDRLLRRPAAGLLLRAPQDRDHRRLLTAFRVLGDLLFCPGEVLCREGELLRLKLGGCEAAGCHRSIYLNEPSLDRLAVARRDRRRVRRLGHKAEEEPVLLLQKDARPDRAGDRAHYRKVLREQALHGHVLLRARDAAGCRQDSGHEDDPLHRSTSPNTMSIEPMMAETSASMWPRQRESSDERCGKPGARILHL